jgi:hypothetical protein
VLRISYSVFDALIWTTSHSKFESTHRQFGRPVYNTPSALSEEKSTFEFVADEKPTFAGIDPYNKLIDRDPADNLIEVEEP